MNDIVIQNDIRYLFLQWIGWDYNFWTVIFADVILFILFFGIMFLIGFMGMLFKWW